jgi:hypothetical protein
MPALLPTPLLRCLTDMLLQWAQMIEFYMSDEYHHHWANITTLAQSNSAENFETLKKYVLER